MAIEFEVDTKIEAEPERIYAAWLDSQAHSQMTGGEAKVSAVVGEAFEAWDGYISGRNLELEAPRRILQRWRTTEFSETEEDSMLEVTFQLEGNGTVIRLRHWNLPEHGMQYRQGWVDAYFEPMKAYFEGSGT